VTTAEVHFINDKTGEYLFYTLSLKAETAGVLQTISMQAPLRQLTSHMLPLHNLLDVPTTFSASVNNGEVSVPGSITVEAGAKAELPIEWRPLLLKETTSQLSLNSPELGAFLYDLRLQALPAGESKTLQFKVALGNPQTLRFRFPSYLKKPETYKLAIGSGPGGDFECEATLQAPAAEGSNGVEVAVDVTFEPSRMGDMTDTLTISSADGGEYTCLLKGTALPPRPQGPIVIKGAPAQVTFKNVFTSAADFSFACDPPNLFSVAKPKENVPPKKAITVPVTYKPDGTSTGKVSGKLTVSGPEGFTQLYYLSGES